MPSPLVLAVDFGGTKVEAALVDAEGRVVAGSRHRRPTGHDATSAQLEESVAGAVRAAYDSRPEGAELLGVGIGSAGPLDVHRGLISPFNVPAWRDYPMVELVERTVPGLPVTLRIDGVAIALAEHWVGAAQGYASVLGMIVSTGVGGGFLLGGRAAPSPTGNGGHIGHVEVAGFTDPCVCGGAGCLEAIASGPNTVAWARTQGFAGTTGEDLAAAHAAGDPVALAAVERSGTALGLAIGSAAALLDLDVVAVGGGFSRVSPVLFDHARAAVARRVNAPYVTRVKLVPSGLSDEGPLIGAAALVHRAELVA